MFSTSRFIDFKYTISIYSFVEFFKTIFNIENLYENGPVCIYIAIRFLIKAWRTIFTKLIVDQTSIPFSNLGGKSFSHTHKRALDAVYNKLFASSATNYQKLLLFFILLLHKAGYRRISFKSLTTCRRND